jgi:mRNA-degrading endonuclease RelE of RelBE toxin-antitoxin system
MPLKAEFRPRFKKELKALPQDDQADINQAINNLLRKTGTFDVIRLHADVWRLKIGRWRVFFSFNGEVIVFLTVERWASKTY